MADAKPVMVESRPQVKRRARLSRIEASLAVARYSPCTCDPLWPSGRKQHVAPVVHLALHSQLPTLHTLDAGRQCCRGEIDHHPAQQLLEAVWVGHDWWEGGLELLQHRGRYQLVPQRAWVHRVAKITFAQQRALSLQRERDVEPGHTVVLQN
eukprot:scaffold11456_cov136-Isochrysis_galbana.AAC.2